MEKRTDKRRNPAKGNPSLKSNAASSKRGTASSENKSRQRTGTFSNIPRPEDPMLTRAREAFDRRSRMESSSSTRRTKESFEKQTASASDTTASSAKKTVRRSSAGVKSNAGRPGSASEVRRRQAASTGTDRGRTRRVDSQTNNSARKTASNAASTTSGGGRRQAAVRRRRQEREIQRRKNQKRLGCLVFVLLLFVFVVTATKLVKSHLPEKDGKQLAQSENNTSDQMEKTESEDTGKKEDKKKDKKKDKEDKKDETSEAASTQAGFFDKVASMIDGDSLEEDKQRKEIIDAAVILAAGYDYDAAIEKIKTIEKYEEIPEVMEKISEWETTKEKLVAFGPSDVIHIFYHTLVVETDLAFECAPGISNGFKMWMTTVDEFDRITQKMYDDGYVLCSLYDFFEENYDNNGVPHFKEKYVYLPEGKKPFILSLDDLSYYHTYTDHGMATKLVLDDNGKITCQYKQKDGTIVTGSYDCVPRMNDFMTAHPDGAYRGARGTIALTGYNGIFGYRTDKSYVTRENLDKDKLDWLAAHPDYDYDKECAQAKIIADELKAEGWDFASHTWGHIRIGKAKLEKIKADTEKWLANVAPIIGKTECIIFAHGQDLASSDEYNTETNAKYKYLTSKGFHIYLNVDSHQKTMQVHDVYVHGGRRNLDGYRLWTDAHGNGTWTNDLFDASEMLDSRRTDMPNPD